MSPRALDGMAYMDKAVQIENNADVRLADDKAAIQWLLHNVQGSPVILEAQHPRNIAGAAASASTLACRPCRAGTGISASSAENRAEDGNRAPSESRAGD